MKKTSSKYRSEAFEAIHQSAVVLHRIGAIGKKTMREFDESCLEKREDIKPLEIRALREKARISQPVFAHYMNVSKNLVSAWERGTRKPGGPALRLLGVIRKHGIEALA